MKLTKQLSILLNTHLKDFLMYDRIIVYYDFGQMELAKIIVSVFNAILNNTVFKKANPAEYKLFQAADMICTMELLALKAERKSLTKSELAFFASARKMYSPYLKTIQRKKIF